MSKQVKPTQSPDSGNKLEDELRKSNQEGKAWFNASLGRLVGVFGLFFILHALGVFLFLGGFLLTRLVLDDKSQCALPPIAPSDRYAPGDVEKGCWHPKTFNKAVVVIVDALRYDFTVPFQPTVGQPQPQHFHDALTVFNELAVSNPENALLLPFIADPPTTTLQRLKGLTTGTLPTFIDAGSNFAGTAIDEDNIVAQLNTAGKTVVHLGDDTWHSLFPGLFDPELTRPYDSLNVWDLFTVDNGVTDHIFPLLDKSNASRWDVIFGHYLGVDHAGHRYGPDHPAMASKLKEMNGVFTRMIDQLDDDTLLVVMGDHGMDPKGDHGGESDEEIEAAIWMYSKKAVFGRLPNTPRTPPATAKDRQVRQIDLVPTLSLLLGLPIPFNNLGRPINEAFAGRRGMDYPNLAKVNRMTAAQIHRYQDRYAEVRKLEHSSTPLIDRLWAAAHKNWDETLQMRFPPVTVWTDAYLNFAEYAKVNLDLCRDLWARFDNVGIVNGISVLAGAFVLLAVFARGLNGQRNDILEPLLYRGYGLGAAGVVLGFGLAKVLALSVLNSAAYCASLGALIGITSVFYSIRQKLSFGSRSLASWSGAVAVLLLCIGFAANSFTIWEDDILLFFLMTFGFFLAAASLRQADPIERFLGITQSAVFIACTRAASLSRLCREEQMPHCRSTYYASASSSTSSWQQLMIPLAVAVLLPGVIKTAYARSQNYHGSAVLWIGVVFRASLSLIAAYWLLDAADDHAWLPVASATLKTTKTLLAQLVLALAFAVGYSTHVFSPPFINVEQRAAPAATAAPTTTSAPVNPDDPTSEIFTSFAPAPAAKPQILIFGYANTLGTRFLLLPLIWALPLLLLTKPMGQGSLALQLLSILALLEVLDTTAVLRATALGPVVLALLARFHFFKTGHQAALASIQWESAFVPLASVRYPWSPLLVAGNTFAPLILSAVAVPALALWKIPPRTSGREILERVGTDVATFLAVWAVISAATAGEAAWLRRHLMLYRVFMPRMLLAAVEMLVADVVAVGVGLVGVRWAVVSVGDVFGWA